MSAQFNAESMYTYLKGYAMGRKLTDTIKALAFARELHKDQLRNDGQPYIVHPLTMACHAITIGLDNDVIIAACLLHDVVEDCGMTVEELPVSMETKRTVMKLTHLKPTPLSVYYQGIMSHNYASIVKLLDRCNNVSTMAGVFTVAKVRDYIEETREYVLPLIRSTKDHCPELSDALFVLKYHIISIIDGLEAALNAQ